jgi:hypothetical protein
VKDYVRLKRVRIKETFVPLAHPPGHAQVDFGQCLGIIGGVRTVLHVGLPDPRLRRRLSIVRATDRAYCPARLTSAREDAVAERRRDRRNSLKEPVAQPVEQLTVKKS